MTRKQWAKLSDDEKRIKVAELCGWKKTTYRALGYKRGAVDAELWLDAKEDQHEEYELDGERYPFPDYLNDLNAMHEAEQLLHHLWDKKHPGASAWDEFMRQLELVVGDRGWVATWNATAAQRAEAFVLTKEPE